MAKFLQKKAERNFLEKAERNVEKLKKRRSNGQKKAERNLIEMHCFSLYRFIS